MRYVFTLLFVGLLPLAASAQDGPKGEIFGGYSYARSEGTNLNGWEASGTGYFTDNFGIEADFSGHYRTTETTFPAVPPFTTTPQTIRSEYSVYSFLAGPHVRFQEGRLAPFAHAVFGASRASVDLSGTTLVSPDHDTGFAMAAGGGVDVELSDSVSVRLVQADYYMTRFGARLDGARISTGIVFTFGR